jgi:hypothetical protein
VLSRSTSAPASRCGIVDVMSEEIVAETRAGVDILYCVANGSHYVGSSCNVKQRVQAAKTIGVLNDN